MSTVNQKEYLKRYLSKDKDKKKKKKKVPKGVHNRVKIIDDNIDVHEQVQTIQDIENENEDAPQVVAVIDERPVELRLNKFKDQSNWTTFDLKPVVKQEADSPDRNGSNIQDYSGRNKKQENSPDECPPRRNRKEQCDESLPRRKITSNTENGSPSQKCETYDSDENPPRRRSKHTIKDNSLPRRSRYNDSSPPRRNRNCNSDDCPPGSNKNYDAKRKKHDQSPPRRTKYDDANQPRRNNKYDSDESPPRRNTNREKDSKRDQSPPRRRKDDKGSSKRNTSNDSDESPPRTHRNKDVSFSDRTRNLSPSHNCNSGKKSRWASKSPSPKPTTSNSYRKSTNGGKATKTLDGKAAGLQNAKDLVTETENFRKREAKLFEQMESEVSGANAITVIRDRKTGKVRDLEAEAQVKTIHNEKANELKKTYDRWGKGVKQIADYQEKLQAAAYEMSKPLARYADDEDLERHLKEQERAGDPMLQYIKKKKQEDAVKAGVTLKPEYMGEFMPNRYGIHPGHRWDGVDRSNGYEKKWFDAINKRNADREEAYKWNSEDM